MERSVVNDVPGIIYAEDIAKISGKLFFDMKEGEVESLLHNSESLINIIKSLESAEKNHNRDFNLIHYLHQKMNLDIKYRSDEESDDSQNSGTLDNTKNIGNFFTSPRVL